MEHQKGATDPVIAATASRARWSARNFWMDVVHFTWCFAGLWRAYLAYGDYKAYGWDGMKTYEKGWFGWALILTIVLIMKCVQVVMRWV